jgi:CIC family chloride channel protein
MIGGVLGNLLHSVVPSVSQEAFVLVGMAAFFAGAAEVRVASMIMVSGMTGDYFLLAPLMMVCTVSYIVSGSWAIYESQVLNRAMSQAHRGEFSVDILEEIEVQQATIKNVVIAPDDKLAHLSDIAASTGHLVYPLVADRMLRGIVSYSSVLRVPHDNLASMKVKDIMQGEITTCMNNESLTVALRRMDQTGHGHLPFVDANDSSKLGGILCERDLIRGHEACRRGVAFEHVDVLERVKVEEVM